ncbi:MAG: efflux RND transporter periplasmic adaptor subunit [Myxococcota bacterium]|jgi:HlyD family secretion protein|nr:efflux RND transporter periplasmic adaptor subunit [Myxococcota bacterium]
MTKDEGKAETPAKSPESEMVHKALRAGRRGRLRKLLFWLVLVGVVAAGVYWRMSRPEPPRQWLTEKVDRGDLLTTVTATGSLEPRRTIVVGAEVSGRLASVEVEENQEVQQGQVLARFETEKLESSVQTATASEQVALASVERAQATRDEAVSAEKRIKALVEVQSSAASALEQARATRLRADAELKSAKAQVSQAKAELRRAQTELEKAVITSPVTGVVLARNVEAGSTVAASFQAPELFIIAEDLAQMKLELEIDEADVSLVAPGQQATFTVDAWPERVFECELESLRLYPTSTDNVVTYRATLGVANSEKLLRPGMTATATITTGTIENVLRIPTTAFRFTPPNDEKKGGFTLGPPRDEEAEEASSAVWVLRDGTPVRVVPKVGVSDGRYTELKGDELAEGEDILVGVQTVPGPKGTN